MQSRKFKQLQGMKGYHIANNYIYTDDYFDLIGYV